jgi:hypothetical protein
VSDAVNGTGGSDELAGVSSADVGASALSRIRAIQSAAAGEDAARAHLRILWNVLFWSAVLIGGFALLHAALLLLLRWKQVRRRGGGGGGAYQRGTGLSAVSWAVAPVPQPACGRRRGSISRAASTAMPCTLAVGARVDPSRAGAPRCSPPRRRPPRCCTCPAWSCCCS